MIRMLLGMVRPSAGGVELFGTRVRPGRLPIWDRVGYLVETPAAYPERENLEIAYRLRRLARPAVVAEVIERLGLGPYADRRAGTLSLGNAQRLGLAKALIHAPDLLILDEPANGLDPAGWSRSGTCCAGWPGTAASRSSGPATSWRRCLGWRPGSGSSAMDG